MVRAIALSLLVAKMRMTARRVEDEINDPIGRSF